MVKLGCTLPKRSIICLHKSTDANIYPPTEADKSLLEKSVKLFLGIPLSFLNAKWLLKKLLFKSLQTYANQLLGLMEANSNRIRHVSPCPPVFIGVGISIRRQVASHPDKTRRIALKNKHVLFSTNKTRFRRQKILYNRHSEKVDCLSLDGFLTIATLCLKQWAAFFTLVTVSIYVNTPFLTGIDIKRGSRTGELHELRRSYMQKKVHCYRKMQL